MIISHKHRYLFVQLPNTGSTAIRQELCENYDGARILHKHAYYHEFLKIAKPEESEYFVFSCIRNPLDIAVTIYFKYKTNHRGIYTNPKRWKKNGGHIPNNHLRRFKYVAKNNLDFPTYFKKFYKLPYDNWSSLSHEQFGFVIRYENLQRDFSKLLSLLGLHQKRPLPVVNKTAGKEHFLSYYTPDIHDRARWVFGPFLKKWGYDFPPEWGSDSVPWTSQKIFDVLSFARRRLFWGPSSSAQLVKRLVESFQVDVNKRFAQYDFMYKDYDQRAKLLFRPETERVIAGNAIDVEAQWAECHHRPTWKKATNDLVQNKMYYSSFQ